ncbi:hypothetical protein VTK73DRAFT_1613 [Phialemonium thermophilum]|uniref:3-hydroxyisobutyryl-CoA hydrolase n=1 Tax=Phialemonium thermophilum TaxID=223376 RepID=A0ABR3X8P9_9PEZI
MSTSSIPAIFRPAPEDEPEDVLFNSLYGLRSIELNRPKQLNSLNGSMIRKIVPRLLEWQKSDMANVIVMKGAGEKAFCAGGDVKALALANQKGPEGQKWSTGYFELEYKLNHLVATYPKPYVAFMDGITMGGGVGLSIHAPIRIATERTLFAMPETTIGFFPDVGASFFLPRMAGATGTYLALTSDRLKGVNTLYAGVATHYLHSSSLPALESRLAELRFRDYDDMPKRLQVISATIDEFATGLPHDEPMLLAGELRRAVDRCFDQDSVTAILQALERETQSDNGDVAAWATRTIRTLHERSPTSVYVALRQMRIGRSWTIAETFKREHQMAAQFMRHPDFTEGVSALLIRKDKTRPKWQPATLEDIRPEDNVSERFFEKPEGVEELTLLNNEDYWEYPYRQFGMPSEHDVEKVVTEKATTPGEVLRHFAVQTRAKQGVTEVVQEILARKTYVNAEGLAVWQN